jgi:hypothetical protein
VNVTHFLEHLPFEIATDDDLLILLSVKLLRLEM